jgi:hypothetical protein
MNGPIILSDSTVITTNIPYGVDMSQFGLTNWSLIPLPIHNDWSSISTSASGEYISTVSQGGDGKFIYVSPDYGRSWFQIDQVGLEAVWVSISLSASGQYQSAVANDGNGIWGSSDYGKTWSNLSNLSYNWSGISLSASGQYQTAVVTNGFIWISSNYGTTWQQSSSINAGWGSISISASGQYQLAVINNPSNGGTWYSTNYGVTWSQTSALPAHWYSVSLSACGQYTYACIFNGGDIYSSFIPNTFGDINSGAILCDSLFATGNISGDTLTQRSDYRVKENVISLDNKFIVDYLNPVTYRNKETNQKMIGLIAHELQEIYPELVNGLKDGAEIQTVNYIGLIPVLINEIKNIKSEIKSLKQLLEKVAQNPSNF